MSVNLVNPDFPDEIVSADGGAIPDTRNVIDHYKYWTDREIHRDLQSKCLPVEVVAENFAHDFNISTVVRNANAFGARGVHLVGRKRWDRRGAVGSYHYTPVRHHPDALAFYGRLRDSGFRIVSIDNIPGAVSLDDYVWPIDVPVVVVFGQESIGISNVAIRHSDAVVCVDQSGSVRSLNVGVCSGIVLHDVARQFSRARGAVEA